MRINLHYKITVIFVLIITLLFSVLYSRLEKNLTEQTYRRIRRSLIKELTLAKTYVRDTGGMLSMTQADAIADTLGKDLGIRATLIDMSGKVRGDSELNRQAIEAVENHLYRPEVQEALKGAIGESRRFSTTLKTDMLYVAETFKTNQTSGIIRLAMPLSDIDVILSGLNNMLMYSLGFVFIFAILFSLTASFFISRPIKEISQGAKAIANGNFSRKLTLQSNDEIGDLVKSLNYMSEQIKMRMDEVQSGKSRLEAVFLSMFEGVMILDAKGVILLMNQTLRDFFKITQDPTGRKPLEAIRNIEIQDVAEKAMNLQSGVLSREITLLLPEERILLLHATPVVRKGKKDGVVLVFHDITQMKHLERIRQDFVANVSHELRTPVTSIKGYSETLLEGALNKKKDAEEFVKIISTDSERLARLIDDLLDLSKIESGTQEFILTRFSVDELVNRILPQFKKQAKAKSVILTKDIPNNLPKAKADTSGVTQVLVNLIDNAVKYNKEGGEVTISAREKGDFIEIRVADTGIGISLEDLPRIFERFYRVDKAHSRELGGTGLGLSIAKHIIQAHNGDITAQSDPGQGTTFRFTLPKA